jgi:hypothetical protein
LLSSVRDSGASAAVLRYLIEAPTLRRQMGVRVQAIVQQEFFKEKVVAETLVVYQELLT